MATSSDLCSNCQSIDFDLLRTQTFDGWTKIADLSWIEPRTASDDVGCVLCNFFSSQYVRSMYDKKGPAALWITKAEFQNRSVSRTYKSRADKSAHDSYPDKVCCVRNQIPYYHDQDPEDYFALFGRENITHFNVNEKSIDFNVIKSWLKECDDCHRCLAKREAAISDVLLIDCHTMQLVYKDHMCPFAALSYVWGPPSIENAHVEYGLPANLPHTIKDAIEVCRNIGIGYLWVDRYCISADADKRHVQIANMHKIYAAAELTIVAAAGEDPWYGLPGVSRRSYADKHTAVKLGKTILALLTRSPQDYVGRSTWNQRAWTYQEAELSIRRLYFTDDQVLYECQELCIQEVAQLERLWIRKGSPSDKLSSVFATFDVGRSRPHLFSNRGPHDMKDMATIIQNYSPRDLTYQRDKLNAILGMLQSYCSGDEASNCHYWGIPMETRAGNAKARQLVTSSEFLRELAWDIARPSERIVGLPSWSWVGWTGHVRLLLPHRDLAARFGIFDEDIKLHIELANGHLQAWEEYFTRAHAFDLRDVSPYLHIYGPTIKLAFKVSDTSPIHLAGHADVYQTTYEAYFLTSSHTRDVSHINFTITGKGQSGDWLHEQLLNSRCECILLSGTKLVVDITWMVVCWRKDIAERVGIVRSGFREACEFYDMPRAEGAKSRKVVIRGKTHDISLPEIIWKTVKLG